MPTIRVVLADDHPSLRAGVRARMSREPDIEVVGETGSGTEAIQMVMDLMPHVLLLDMQMLDASGIEVARQLRASNTAVRILALSAYDDAEYVVELLECGVAGYLTKQEPLETIVSAVRGVAAGEEGWLSRGVAAALMRHRRQRVEDDLLQILSGREREVLMHLATGETNREIGEHLFIAESTVKKHVNNIYFKLELGSRAEAVAWAWKHGIAGGNRPSPTVK